jgi:methylglutaconyl-CoA hydratase
LLNRGGSGGRADHQREYRGGDEIQGRRSLACFLDSARLPPAAIIIPQLCDAIGIRQVRRYALIGERFGAAEAHRIGLVHEVVPLDDLDSAGAKVVEQLLANGPQALAQTKALAMESSFDGMSVDDEIYARLVRMHAKKRQTEEASEGLASFAEKRAANWDGGKA